MVMLPTSYIQPILQQQIWRLIMDNEVVLPLELRLLET